MNTGNPYGAAASASAAAAAGGNPFENKLLLQYMSGAGAAMSAGEPIGPALNQITQQNISTQNFMKMLQKMMGGEIPQGGKITMDEKGMSMNIPKSALSALGGTAKQEGSQLPGGSGTQWNEGNVPKAFNPFQ